MTALPPCQHRGPELPASSERYICRSNRVVKTSEDSTVSPSFCLKCWCPDKPNLNIAPRAFVLPVIPAELEPALWPGPRDKVLRMHRPLRCRLLGDTIRQANGRAVTRRLKMV